MQRAGSLRYIVINAQDYEMIATFWSEVLGQPIKKRFGPYIELAGDGTLGVSIQRVRDMATSRESTIHFDLKTDDLDASTGYIEELGGRLIEVRHEGRWEWRVMADPEGNLFCLVP